MSEKHPQDRFDSLDTPEANEMFVLQARIMREHGVKSVLDVGCRSARPLEWLDDSITYHGFDIVPEVPSRLAAKYPESDYPNTDWRVGDWHDPPFQDSYDCLVFGGMFYYNKDEVVPIMERYIEKYQPRLVLICDIDYKSPAHWWAADFSELKEKYHHREYSVQLPPSFHGMNRRVVFEIDLQANSKASTQCLLRKDLAPLDPSYQGYQAPSYPIEEMMEWIYVTNTEPLDNIGRDMHKTFELDYWIGVAAGFKPYYTLAKFGVKYNTRVIYADVSAREIDWRMYFDQNYRVDMSDQDLTQLYLDYKDMNPTCEFIRGNFHEAGEIIRREREFLDISDSEWKQVWEKYRDLEKIYLTTNIIDNIDSILEIIKPGTNDRTTNAYVWTSNAWDWHQFRYEEKDFNAWTEKVRKHLGGEFWYDGKLPPFSSMR